MFKPLILFLFINKSRPYLPHFYLLIKTDFIFTTFLFTKKNKLNSLLFLFIDKSRYTFT